jgi:branched-chain amino acid transport system substrate-binding protein
VTERRKPRLGRWIVAIGLVLLIAFVVFSRINFYPKMRDQRERRALASTGPVQIAAVWPPDQGAEFLNGVELAVEEVNADLSELGRPLVLHVYPEPTISEGLEVARAVGRNLDYVAVLGHYRREVALPASITYETTGTLYLATSTTSHHMTQHGFQYVLQNAPEDTQLAECIAETATRLKIERVAVVFVRSVYGEQFARSFVEACFDAGLEIVFWSSDPEVRRSFLPIIAELRDANPDGIVVVDGLQRAEILIRQIRTMGIDKPILGGPILEDRQLLESLGSLADKLYIHSPFLSSYDEGDVQDFVEAYRARFDSEPNYHAALAYEAVKLLAQVIARTGETAPITMATNLKYGGGWTCLDGPCSFLGNGLIARRRIFVKEAHAGQFRIFRICGEEIGGS